VTETNSKAQLFSVDEAGRVLGGISPWTLRKHIAVGNVRVTRIGRRVFLPIEELDRIQQEGLPSLASSKAAGDSLSTQIHSGEEQ
jgi:hypothetical protein